MTVREDRDFACLCESVVNALGMRALRGLIVIVGFLAMAGCSTVTASSVRTGTLRLPPNSGPVALYAAGIWPEGQDLGLVEVHARESEGTIETLLPLFVQKVAQLGGNAAVIDGVTGTFDIVTHARTETYSYACGFHATCTGTRMVPVSDEVMTVSIHGRAVVMRAPPVSAGGMP